MAVIGANDLAAAPWLGDSADAIRMLAPWATIRALISRSGWPWRGSRLKSSAMQRMHRQPGGGLIRTHPYQPPRKHA
ncbi:MAG: hypothetical protein ACREXN_15625 [Polaromonas sp.]